jgi:hypothetical protein
MLRSLEDHLEYISVRSYKLQISCNFPLQYIFSSLLQSTSSAIAASLPISLSIGFKPAIPAIMAKKHKTFGSGKAVAKSAKKQDEIVVKDIIAHFAKTYNNDRLSALQKLCEDLGVESGTSIRKCREVPSDRPPEASA